MPIQGFKCKEPYTGLHMLGLARELWRRVQGLPEATDARMVAGTHLGNALVSQGSYAEAVKLHRTIYDVRTEHLSLSSFLKCFFISSLLSQSPTKLYTLPHRP